MTLFSLFLAGITIYHNIKGGDFHEACRDKMDLSTGITIFSSLAGKFLCRWVYIYARGEGMVIGEPALVAAEFNATIREVLAKQGQVVSKGEVVLHITSQYMAESQARLTSESVQRSAKLAEMQIRSEIINATLASAETREEAASEGKARLDTLYDKGYLDSHRGRRTSLSW